MTTKAKESPQIERARNKIKQQLAEADKYINAESLKKMTIIIQRQILRHKPERINLKSKSVTLFDENKHPAKTESQFINHLLRELRNSKNTKRKNNLEGRITPVNH